MAEGPELIRDAHDPQKREVLSKARIIFDSQVATPALTVVVEEGRKILAYVKRTVRQSARSQH